MRKVCLAVVVLLAVACVESEAPIDHDFVNANLLSQTPSPKIVVNGDFGGKVVYLGADIDKTSLVPGDTFTVVHYWQVTESPGSQWRIFTHVDGNASKDWMNVDGTKMRTNHGPDKWKAGEVIRDEQKITLKKNWSSPFAIIHVGMYRKGGSGVNDRMAILKGPKGPDRKLIVRRIPVTGVVAPPVLSGYSIRKTTGPIVIDGKSTEADWGNAQSTGPFKDAEGGSPVGATTLARLLYDDKNLYVFLDVKDSDVFSPYTKRDDTLWKADVVELFIDADKNRRGYVELQVNPNNTQLDSWFKGTRREGGDEAWNSNMKSAVTVEGTADKRSDADQGWHVEIAIPFEAVKGRDDKMVVNLPPKPGDSWRINIVRVEKKKGAKQITASAWAQISIQDFHAMDRLLQVTFADALGKSDKPAAVPNMGAGRPLPVAKGKGTPATTPPAVMERTLSPGTKSTLPIKPKRLRILRAKPEPFRRKLPPKSVAKPKAPADTKR